MSIDVVSNIGPVVPQLFATEGVRTWNQECPLLAMLAPHMEMGRTQYVSWAVSNSGATGGFIAEKDNINTSTEYGVNDRTKAQLNRAIARTGFGFSHTELATVTTLDRDVAADFVIDRLKDAWLESLSYICRKIETALAFGTGTETSISNSTSCNGIVGVISALLTLNAGGSYAGLTGYAGMTPYVHNVTSTVVQKDFDNAFAAIQNAAGGITPDFIMCSPNTASVIKNQFGDTNVRLLSTNEAAAYKLGTQGVMTASRPTLSYNHVPVIINSAWHAAGYDGYVLIGRTQDLVVNVLPYAGWGDSVLLEHKQGIGSFADVIQQLGLPFFCYAPGKLGANVTFAMECELQLKIKAGNRFSLLYGAGLQ